MKRLLPLAFATFIAVAAPSQSIRLGEQLQKLLVAQTAISNIYVDPVNDSVLVEAAIEGMLSELDPHSTYMTAEEVRKSQETLEGNFEGIGVQFNMVDDTLFVIQTIPDGPCGKCGIVAGDRFVTADDTCIAGVGMSNAEIMNCLRGPKGSTVRLGVCRRGVPGIIYFNVVRDRIPVNTVDASYMAAPGVGYIRISSFGNTTVDEFEDALARLRKKGMNSLILDLQGNGGGYLTAAVNVANEFLRADNLIVYTDGRAGKKVSYSATGNGRYRTGRLVVLIDEYSASASEIVSGALQDWDRAVVIGRRSFGKGLVQSPVEFPDGSMMRLTIAKYYTPSGRCIQKPYGDEVDYANDIAERLASGQLVSADSIHFADSLKYTTLVEGRTVYGGGGVMPDIFVPIDTTRTTAWFRQASAHGAILQSSLNYLEENRRSLQRKYRTFESFKNEFETGDDALSLLLEKAAAAGVEFNEDEYTSMLPYITVQMKALIARGLWGMNEYYAIINRLEPIYIRALEYLEEENS